MGNNGIKRIFAGFAAIIIIGTSSLPCYADGKSIERTQTYESDNANQKADFEKEIYEDGTLYVLDDVQYTVKEKPIMSEGETRTKTFTQKGLTSASYAWEDTRSISDGEKNYTGTLQKNTIVYKSEGIESREQTVSLDKTYEKCTEVPSPPKTYTYAFANPFTGSYEDVTMDLVAVNPSKYTWVNDVNATITFLNYSAKRYQFKDRTFLHNDDECPLNEDLDFVRDYLGYDAENYEVVSVQWDGPANTDADTRVAKVEIKRKIFDYKATYSSKHTFYGKEKYTSTATYEYNTSGETGEVINVITAVATYIEKNDNSSSEDEEPSSEDSSDSVNESIAESEDDNSSLADPSSETKGSHSSEDSSSSKSSTDYFNPMTTSEPDDKEKEENSNVAMIAAGLAAFLAMGGGLFFLTHRKAIVYDENLQQIGKVKLSRSIDVTAFAEKTNRNILIKASKSFITKNRRELEIKASGERLHFTFDDKFIEITNPNNYKV